MARKRKSAARQRRALSYGVFIPLAFGLFALLLQLFVFSDVGPVFMNVLNWFVGIGFVGGVLAILTVFGSRFLRGDKLW